MILILAQLALLFLTAWGWGFWLWKISRAGQTGGWRRYGWFFFGLGGFMSCVLFLHSLIFLNLPLKYTAWAGLLVAAAGIVACVWGWYRNGRPARRNSWREIAAAGLLFATVFGFQGTPLFLTGPKNYYGSAHIDQINYVLLAEFLIEKPLSTTLGDIGLHPWLAKAIALKDFRKGQSVAQGYLAVISLSDAKRVYGTLSVFMVAIGALSVFVLARVLSVPRTLAWLVGIWWGLLPAVTKLHLDGFFSQACILFVFPAMAAAFRVRRGRLEYAPLLLLTVYLAYLLCAYTEVYLIGVGLLVCMVMFGVPARTLWRWRGAAVTAVATGSLLLNGLYLRFVASYIVNQYGVAADALLTLLTPLGGTWVGWKQVFVGYATFPNAKVERLSMLAGFALLFLIACAFQLGGLARRRFLLAMIAPPAGVLILLLSAPELAKYPFSKLVDTFTPFWLVLAALGLLSLSGVLVRGRVSARLLTWPTVGLLIFAAFHGSWPQWREIWENRGVLEDVNSAGARSCYALARLNPKAVYLIDETHSIVCAWLAYAARDSETYVATDRITDLALPPSIYSFRKTPPPSPNLVILDEKGPVMIKDRAGLPLLAVQNPQGAEGKADQMFYWIGPEATLTLSDYVSAAGETHFFALGFEAAAGPANPVPERSIVLVGPDGSEQRIDFVGRTTGRFRVKVHGGDNVYKLKVVYPTEQTVVLPGDPRNHMVFFHQVTLGPWIDPGTGNP